MVGEVSWILGFPEQARVTEKAEFLEACKRPEMVYGGFLWSDLRPENLLESFHQRLLLDFQVGWDAVGLTSRGPVDLGPWSAPTSARAHHSAPYGLYLLSRDRLHRSLPSKADELSLDLHSVQPQLGPIFCDPGLEVSFERAREFHYKPPSALSRVSEVGRFLFRGFRS